MFPTKARTWEQCRRIKTIEFPPGQTPAFRTKPQVSSELIFFSFSNRKSSLSDSKMPSLYTSWTLSTSSLSSQGSISENSLRQSRPLKPALLPVPVTSAVRTTAVATSGQASLRRGRGSTRKSKCLGGVSGREKPDASPPNHTGCLQSAPEPLKKKEKCTLPEWQLS